MSAISYGARQALDDVSFTVAPGAFCVLLGLNGAGKSTHVLADHPAVRAAERRHPRCWAAI